MRASAKSGVRWAGCGHRDSGLAEEQERRPISRQRGAFSAPALKSKVGQRSSPPSLRLAVNPGCGLRKEQERSGAFVRLWARPLKVVGCYSAPLIQAASAAKFKRRCPMSSVYFGGSRHLIQGQCPQLASLVPAVQAAGQVVHVGCCIGADQQVIQAGLSVPSFLVVFAAFGPSGAGGCSLSAFGASRAAERAGAQVNFFAGGSLEIPLEGRLIRRSQAALSGCSAAVFFHPGGGSMAVARFAVLACIPLFVVGPRPLSFPAAGCWQPAQFSGVQCWQFQSAQAALF